MCSVLWGCGEGDLFVVWVHVHGEQIKLRQIALSPSLLKSP